MKGELKVYCIVHKRLGVLGNLMKGELKVVVRFEAYFALVKRIS